MSLLLLLKSGAPAGAGGSIGAPASLPHLAMVLHKAYTLTAEQGTYSLSGQDAGLRVDYALTAEQGTYAIAGQDAGLLYGDIMPADQGSYSVAGQDANLLYGRVLTAESGTYSLTGYDATLTYSGAAPPDSPAPLPHLGLLAGLGTEPVIDTPAPLPHLGLLSGLGYIAPALTAAQGTYAVTGYDAVFVRHYVLTANTGLYDLTGQVAILQAGAGGGSSNPAPLPHIGLMLGGTGNYVMTADPGVYSILGSDALADFEITAEQGTYSLAGQDAGLLRGYVLPAESGTYTLTGQDSTYSIGGAARTMAADTGFYSITGQDAALGRQITLTAEQGFYGLLGQAATLFTGSNNHYTMPAESGTYALTGQDATLVRGQPVLQADTGYYRVLGFDTVTPTEEPAQQGSGRKAFPSRYRQVAAANLERERLERQNREFMEWIMSLVACGVLDDE